MFCHDDDDDHYDNIRAKFFKKNVFIFSAPWILILFIGLLICLFIFNLNK